jgi:hypothetical protein
MTSGAGSPRAFLGKGRVGPTRRGDAHDNEEADREASSDEGAHRAREAGGQGGRGGAEEVLLADALAVRAIIARMQESVQK